MHRHRRLVLSAATAAVFAFAASQAHAANYSFWYGTSSTDWADSANWAGNSPKQDLTSSIADFYSATTYDPTINTSTETAALYFPTSHTISSTGGATLTLGTAQDTTTVTFSIEASGGADATLDVPVIGGSATSGLVVVADDSSTVNFNKGISGTTLNITNANSSGKTSQVNINAPATFSGALNISGSTNVYLAANQQIAGSYNISSGGISIDSASALGTSNINLGTSYGDEGSLTVSSSSDMTVANNFNVQSNYYGDFTGGGTITNNGSGNLNLSGNIQIGSAPSVVGQLTVGGTGNTTISGDINAVHGTSGYANYADSNIVKTGSGTLTITGNNASTWGTNEGNGFGDLIVEQGTVQLRGGNAIGSEATIFVETAGTLDLGGQNQTIGVLTNRTDETGGSVTLGSATLTFNGGSGNFSGVISGTGGIVVTGDAYQVLSGTNTYSGGTVITNGNLLAGSNVPLSGPGAFGNSSSPIIVGDSQTTTGAFVGISGDGTYDGTNFHPVIIAQNIQFSAGAAQTRGIDASTDNGVISGDIQLAGSDILINTNAPEELFNNNIDALTITGHITGNGGLVIEGGSGGLILTGNAAGENATRDITIASGNLFIKDNTPAGTTPILLGTDQGGGSPAGLYTIASVTVARNITIGSGAAYIGQYGNFNSTFSGNIQITGGNYVSLDAEGTAPGDSVTFSGVISGTGGIDTYGPGLVILSGNNTFSSPNGTLGVVNLENGTLRVSSDDNLGPVPSTAQTGYILMAGGALSAGATLTLNSNRGIEIAGSTTGTLDVVSGAVMTYTGAISPYSSRATSSLLKTGDGTLSLSGTSTYTGTTTVQAGTLLVGANVTSNANTPLGKATSAVVLGNSSSGTNDAPTLLINGAYTFGRGLTISSGAATPTFGNNTDNNATFSGNITLGHATDIYSAAVSSGNALTVSGVLSGSNGITLTGPGTTVLSATNTFTGKVNINSGVLSVATINNVSASSGSNLGKQTTVANATIGIGAGTLKYTGATVTTNRPISLSTTGGTLDGSGTGLLTVDVASGNAIAGTNTSFTLAGSTGGKINDPISLGTGSLSKSGTGTWTLAAANSYTGATNVSGGTLALASTSSITSSSSINISSGATFDASAFSTFNIGSSQMLTGTGGTAKGTYSIAGTLDGSVMFDHNVTMGSNSTLQGTGTITGNINTGGTIKGAGSIVGNISSTGSITDRYITGNVTLSGNGSLGGNAVVNGNVQLSTPGSQLSGDVKITGTLSGSGIVGPGNSPGLLTATHLDPSAGMSFNFEMTKDGAPDYANIADIGNDVLRLTDSSTPLSTPFTSANVVNFYIENTAFNGSSSETMLGGLFTDSTTPNVLSSLSSATINYYVETPGGSISYNGNTYSPLNTSSFSTHLSVIADSADFASGMVNGQVTELSITTAVPLPGSAVAGTVLLAGLYIRRTRSRRRAIKGNRI